MNGMRGREGEIRENAKETGEERGGDKKEGGLLWLRVCDCDVRVLVMARGGVVARQGEV